MPPLKINTANTKPRMSSSSGIHFIKDVTVDGSHKLTVKGDGPADDIVCCTLVRLGKTSSPAEEYETIARTTRFIDSATIWTVVFEVKDVGIYVIACHSGTENDYVEVRITSVPVEGPRSIKPYLSMVPPQFLTTAISTTGTVFNANNPVTCTLTRKAADGTTVQMTPDGGGPPIPSPSQTALAVFTNPPTNTKWAVSFAPVPPDTAFSGSYVLEATAPNEGSVSASGPAE